MSKEMLLMGPRLFDIVFGMDSDCLLAVSPRLALIPIWSSDAEVKCKHT